MIRRLLTCGLFFVGLALMPGVGLAQMDPQTETCRIAWSKGFDAARIQAIENPDFGLGVLLHQDDVAPTDMWASYRSVSLANRCMLQAVCQAVFAGGDEASLATPLVPLSRNGGAIPGPVSGCPRDMTILEMLEGISSEGLFSPQDLNACNFNQETAATELRSKRMEQLYRACRLHARVETKIFDRVLRNKMMDDTVRKVVGTFATASLSIIEGIKLIQDDADEMVGKFNNVINQLCTLANTD